MVRTQETPHFRQTRIVVASAMAQLGAEFFGIEPHRTEFVDVERPSEPPDSLLFEDRGTAVLLFDRDVTDQKQR